MKKPPKPHKTHKLPVGDGHTLHVEESGNPQGLPVIILHGGPGGSISESNHKRFPLKTYRLIAFDQRGCGKSKSVKGPLHANTTPHQIADIEKIRTHLKIEKWAVAGASWGSTLALAYAQAYPKNVLGLIVSGIYLGRQHETEWFTHPSGLANFFPQEYATLLKLTGAKPQTLAATSVKILNGSNKPLARKLAEAWSMYEGLACSTAPNPFEMAASIKTDKNLVTSALIETHYFAHHCFLKPNQLLAGAAKIRHLPTHIINGWMDLVCPVASAKALHAALPASHLILLSDCGHFGAYPALTKARLQAAISLAKQLKTTKPLAHAKK